MKISKKAMSAGFLVAVIIVILSFMLIAGTIARFFADAEEKEAEQLCQSSVSLRATAAISLGKGAIEARLSPLLCKTIEKEISGDRNEVQKIIADKMAKCWDMFGAGVYKTSTFENSNLFGHENNCFVCYVIPVEKIADDEGDTKITYGQFENFLTKNKIKGADYLSYIQSKAGGQGYVTTALTPEGITENRAYGIVYKGKKGKCENCGTLAVGGAVLILPAAVIGALSLPVTASVAGILAISTGIGVGVESEVIIAKIRDFIRAEQAGIDGVLLVDISDENLKNTIFNECNYVSDIAGK